MDTICYFHKDMDGIAAGAIVKRKYPDAECIGVNYGDDWDAATVKGKRVFVVDFSFPDMEKLAAIAKSLYWIDHHGTAAREYWQAWQDDNIKGLRDLAMAGCELTWMYLFPNVDTPRAIELVGDRDMWEFNFEETKLFHEAASIVIKSPEDPAWTDLLNDNREIIDQMIDWAHVLLAAQRIRIERVAANGTVVDSDAMHALLVNATSDISELGQYIYSELGFDLAIIYQITDKGVRFSLRSDKVDCAKIAEMYGGGGHKGAAGFTLESLEEFSGL